MLTVSYKNIFRELGRKPSEERVSLYVRKPSIDAAATSKASPEPENKTKQLLDSMAVRRSMEVPTEFLKTIEEEKSSARPQKKSAAAADVPKKFPFNR
jgi:hypothetical protein